MEQLIEYVARALVSSPQEVEVKVLEGPEGPVCKLKVAAGDIGKIIGKDGRTIHALRTVASSRLANPASKLQLEVEAKSPANPSNPANPLSPPSP
ncbi:MAG: KH domain-containing protein [Cystobacterineae bacterium]|nr:KH domain-containing protein [Cystobacterineae bacterium]